MNGRILNVRMSECAAESRCNAQHLCCCAAAFVHDGGSRGGSCRTLLARDAHELIAQYSRSCARVHVHGR